MDSEAAPGPVRGSARCSAHGAQFAEAALKGASAILTDATGAQLLGEAPVPVLVTENLREYVGPLAALIYGSAFVPRHPPATR